MSSQNRPKTCQVKGCKKVPTVGWGHEREWLCIEHFQERLKTTKTVLQGLARGI